MVSTASMSIYEKILIVDDEPHILHALVKSLRLRGYKAFGIGSGEEALNLLRTDNFSLMVLDLNLPGMDGTTVMQRAKEIQPNLLIIIMTGYASVDTAIAAVKNHAVDYLRKPVKTQLLSDTITKILAENRQRLNKEKLADAVVNFIGAQGILPNAEDTKDRLYLPPVSLDLTNHCIFIDNFAGRIDLSSGETKVLECLMKHPNQALSSKYIAQKVTGTNLNSMDANKIIRPYISRLRRKVPYLNRDPRILDTVHGIGYIFRPRA